jgi:hypothetical protein
MRNDPNTIRRLPDATLKRYARTAVRFYFHAR